MGIELAAILGTKFWQLGLMFTSDSIIKFCVLISADSVGPNDC